MLPGPDLDLECGLLRLPGLAESGGEEGSDSGPGRQDIQLERLGCSPQTKAGGEYIHRKIR